jgi:hypothetical protein
MIILNFPNEAYLTWASFFLGALRLTRPVFGPKHFLVKIQMKVFTARNFLSAKHWAYVDIDVSNYEF